MRSWMFALVVALAATGCTHIKLKHITVHQASTLTDLHYKIVLDNIAMFVVNSAALPWHVNMAIGETGVTDSGNGAVHFPWNANLLDESASLGASREIGEKWGLVPVSSGAVLERLRCAYQRVVGVESPGCEKLLCEEEAEGGKCTKPYDIPQGWFGVGCKEEVPPDACYVGHYKGCYVWVKSDGIDGLSRFTITVQKIAVEQEVSTFFAL